MRILVYEHVSGGGYANRPLPVDVLAEGFAMLRCVVADLRAADHEVTVLLDERLSNVKAPTGADYSKQVIDESEPKKFIQKAAKNYDAFYVIAPETGKTLENFVRGVEGTGKTSLNCEASTIAQVSDKQILTEHLHEGKIATPKTLPINLHEKEVAIERALKDNLAYPIILKPTDGTSCSGITLLEEEKDMQCALKRIKTQTSNQSFLAQEFIPGIAASVSLITNGKKAKTISLNKQHIALKATNKECSYLGGCIPLEHPMKEKAFSSAQRVVEALSGLRGYVGVDLILTEKEVFVLDVNARLTTSYVGLRQVVNFNIAANIISAVVQKEEPKSPLLSGVSCFEKILTDLPTSGAYRKALKINGVISPPFPLSDYATASTMVMGYGDNTPNAIESLEEAKKSVSRILDEMR